MKNVLKNLSVFFEKNPSRKSVLCKPCVCDSTIDCRTYVKPRVICMWKYRIWIDNTPCSD